MRVFDFLKRAQNSGKEAGEREIGYGPLATLPGDRKIWIYGPSAIGKKTLIYNLSHIMNPRDCAFSRAVGIRARQPIIPVVLDNRRAGKSKESVYKMRQDRLALFRNIYQSNFGVTWLIQGQSIDLRDPFLPKLAASLGQNLPNSTAVYLRVTEEIFSKTRAKVRVENALPYSEAYANENETLVALKAIFPSVLIHEMT